MASSGFGGWSNSFCNCCADGPGGCLCGFCCSSCYMAKARTGYDNSNCCLNFMCIGSGIIRDIVREGYGIQGSCECMKCFCPPCNAIQVNAEVTKRGALVVHQGAEDAQWTNGLLNCCSDGIGNCLFAWCCPACMWAQTRTNYDHSGCCCNCCCLGPPAVRNIVREGYGIDGTCGNDICVACCCSCCAAIQTNAEVSTRGDMQSQKNVTYSKDKTAVSAPQGQTQVVMTTVPQQQIPV